MYKLFIKPFLFFFNPEHAHHLALSLFRILLALPGGKWLAKKRFSIASEPVNLFGLNFPNRIGLAAGFDKDGKYIDVLPYFGFGFIELGTVTPLPQSGNPKPRLFRLAKDEALINRMGFNNEGVDALVNRLKHTRAKIIIGGNIGKNKTTPNENAVDDYLVCFDKLFDYVDYFVVNVSSPNTPGLRALQEKEPLTNILQALQDNNLSRSNPKPILLKIAPDLSLEQLDEILEIVNETRLAGIVATNTTISRDHLLTPNHSIDKIGAGGLSGRPLTNKSNEILKYLLKKSDGNIPIIGVGGIHNVASGLAKLKAGAELIQLYTGFIYQGPVFIKRLIKAYSN